MRKYISVVSATPSLAFCYGSLSKRLHAPPYSYHCQLLMTANLTAGSATLAGIYDTSISNRARRFTSLFLVLSSTLLECAFLAVGNRQPESSDPSPQGESVNKTLPAPWQNRLINLPCGSLIPTPVHATNGCVCKIFFTSHMS